MEASDAIRILLLDAGGQRFALPLSAVREVLDAALVAPVPLAPPAFAGVLDVRGRLVPVLDIASLLDIAASRSSAQVVLAALDGDEAEVGFRVDDVAGLSLSQRALPAQPDSLRFISHFVDTSDGAVPLLDIAAVVESLRAGSPGAR